MSVFRDARAAWRGILAISLPLLLVACGASTPPISLAPGGEIIQKAISLQIEQSHQQLGEKLQTAAPELKITRVSVKAIEPLYIDRLAAYHFTGTYNLKMGLSDRQVLQKNNEFDVYIQRQREGKTWRWLKQVASDANSPARWLSYLIR